MRNSKSFQAVFLAYATLLFLGLCDNIRGPLYPEILKEFGVSNTEGSLYFALASLAGFFGGLLSPRLSSRWGTLEVLRTSVFAMLSSQIVYTFAPSFLTMLFSAVLFGTSLGVMGVIQNVLVMQALPAGPLKNKVMSGLHSTYAGASLLAPLLVNLVAVVGFSMSVWRVCFAITGMIGLGILSLTLRKVDLNQQEKETEKTLMPQAHETVAQIYYGVILSSYVLSEILVSSRMALYMRSEFQATLTESSWYTSGFFVCLLLGRIVFTIWSPPMRLKNQLALSLLTGILCLLVGIHFHPFALVAAGFFMGPIYPMTIVAAGQLFPKSMSSALSWAIALASLFVVMMHFVVGSITDHWNLQAALYLAPGFCALALTMLVLYEKIFRRQQYQF